MEQRLEAKQTQNMVMTQQMQQSIKILQLSAAELYTYVMQELENNPFLAGGERGEEVEELLSSQKIDKSDITDDIPTADSLVEKNEAIIDASPGHGWVDEEISGAVYENDSSLSYNGRNSSSNDFSGGDFSQVMEQTTAAEISLRDHVIDQINVDIKDPLKRMIAMHLTDMLDDSGYITINIEELCKALKCTQKTIQDVLKILQSFEPAGIFARDLSECLALQLKDKNRYDPAMRLLVENLHLFAARDFKALKKICNVNDEDLHQMCDEIKALNPKPGLKYGKETVQIIQPDVFLKRDTDGNWQLELNSDILPKVLLNRLYYAKVKSTIEKDDKASRKFMTDQITTANWLVRALDQRAQSILKIAAEIVAQQDKFFRKGIKYLQPITLANIAQNVKLHESTVSRVVNGKYIATPMGMYEMKYFFSSSIQGANGDNDISSKSVKYRIKQLIDNEDHKKILSDDKIAIILKTEGINIARRTVFKYREAMKIPSSFERKRVKTSI